MLKTFYLARCCLLMLLMMIQGRLLQAQTPDLDHPISIDYENVTLEYLLEQISIKSQIKFSYSPDLVPIKQRLSYSCRNKPVVQILSEIFGKTGIRYSVVNSYVVLQSAPAPPPSGNGSKLHTISGTVRDSSGNEIMIGACCLYKRNR